MKACKVCEEIKAANDFYAHGGLICKKCAGKQSVERRKKDPRQLEKIKTYAKEYKQRAEVKEKSRERDRIRTEVRKNNQEWKNRRKELTRVKRQNPEYVLHVREKNKQWEKNNPEKVYEKTRRYQALKAKAMPKWLTKEQRRQILVTYILAKKLEKTTGIKYHVDHIEPLQGKNSCGLHVPWNLRAIPALENRRKSNKQAMG